MFFCQQFQIAVQSAHNAELDKARAEAGREAVLSSLVYASGIQKNLLPATGAFQKAFSDFSVIWDPREIVRGDIYRIKSFDEGAVLCVCDCTGHGTPGALLTMLVVSAFAMIVNEQTYKNTALIIRMLDERLAGVIQKDKISPRSLIVKCNLKP